MKKLMMLAATFATLAASAAVTITDVSARQRWPWNGLVDIDFTIAGAAAGETFAIDVNAEYAGGDKKIAAYTSVTEPIAGTGDSRIVWDLAADYPNFRAEDLRVSVTATPISNDKTIYMVIDLSGGSTATKYPVRYTTKAPAHVQGAANEPCQTTELWMRRIKAPSSPFCVLYFRTANYAGDAFYARFTKDYYIGVFELTQKQYNLITGTWPSWFSNTEYRDSRPVEKLVFNVMTGTWEDPNANPNLITTESPLGKLRAKTGLPINIPTLAQLTYAAMGGAPVGVELYRYSVNGASVTADEISRNSSNSGSNYEQSAASDSGTAIVGSYLPNDYGLYDMLGNVWETTSTPQLDGKWNAYYQTKSGDSTIGTTVDNPVVDPQGCAVSESTGEQKRFLYGSSFSFSSAPQLWTTGTKSSTDNWNSRDVGFRLSMTVE